MRRNLWILDLTFLATAIFAGVSLKDRWQQSKAREAALLRQSVPNAAPPTIQPLPTVGAMTPGAYVETAQHMLFSRDRNPDVILDPPPPPPPPKPMPALPLAYGVMNLGAGPTVILAEKQGAAHHSYRAGERIGEFKIYALNNYEVVFEWEGKYVKKRIEDIADRKPIQLTPVADTNAPTPATTSSAQTTMLGKKEGPGADLGNQSKACVAGDTSPAGTVQDGMRKTVTKTPFGESCRWESAR